VSDKSDQLWPIAGKILLSVCHLLMAVMSCMIGAGMAQEAIQFEDDHPDLLVAGATALLGLYALATTLSLWNDAPPISRSLGAVIVGGGVWMALSLVSAFTSGFSDYPEIGFSLSTGLILTGLSMIWWNEKHATVYCRRRMHLGAVIFNVLVAGGILWVVATSKPRGHMDLGGIVYALFLVLQGIWLVILIVAAFLFPSPPKNQAGASPCYRP
jgi:hypothetical protein